MQPVLPQSWEFGSAASASLTAACVHRREDPEFNAQIEEAQEHAIDMLHSRVWSRAVEGDLEPVYHMGFVVGYIRKFDSKLQIEMLRAYKPDHFKTPGTNINLGVKGDIFVLTEAQRHELQDINRAAVMAMPTDREEWERQLALENASDPTPSTENATVALNNAKEL
jgi:hypothetical protein